MLPQLSRDASHLFLEPGFLCGTNHHFQKIKDPFQEQDSLRSVRFLHLLHVKEQKKKRQRESQMTNANNRDC
ncbi:hypothetical protein MRB53_035628 [Persea americana]|uniref:Uncharacterized protein n=1 Tax=Persea americana TaxID=3435 RepID=A0ACC2K578_PERAE|nr:hypothetical protein MRB53_035628 [Persea americana]